MAKLSIEFDSKFDGLCEVRVDGEPVHGPMDQITLESNDYGSHLIIHYMKIESAQKLRTLDDRYEAYTEEQVEQLRAAQRHSVELMKQFSFVKLFEIEVLSLNNKKL